MATNRKMTMLRYVAMLMLSLRDVSNEEKLVHKIIINPIVRSPELYRFEPCQYFDGNTMCCWFGYASGINNNDS